VTRASVVNACSFRGERLMAMLLVHKRFTVGNNDEEISFDACQATYGP
jgi:hypothetical protein